MGWVMIKCPTTDQSVFTRRTMGQAEFDRTEFLGVGLRCPACGDVHRWEKPDAWLQPFPALRVG